MGRKEKIPPPPLLIMQTNKFFVWRAVNTAHVVCKARSPMMRTAGFWRRVSIQLLLRRYRRYLMLPVDPVRIHSWFVCAKRLGEQACYWRRTGLFVEEDFVCRFERWKVRILWTINLFHTFWLILDCTGKNRMLECPIISRNGCNFGCVQWTEFAFVRSNWTTVQCWDSSTLEDVWIQMSQDVQLYRGERIVGYRLNDGIDGVQSVGKVVQSDPAGRIAKDGALCLFCNFSACCWSVLLFSIPMARTALLWAETRQLVWEWDGTIFEYGPSSDHRLGSDVGSGSRGLRNIQWDELVHSGFVTQRGRSSWQDFGLKNMGLDREIKFDMVAKKLVLIDGLIGTAVSKFGRSICWWMRGCCASLQWLGMHVIAEPEVVTITAGILLYLFRPKKTALRSSTKSMCMLLDVVRWLRQVV